LCELILERAGLTSIGAIASSGSKPRATAPSGPAAPSNLDNLGLN
jgi:hypothetical protein